MNPQIGDRVCEQSGSKTAIILDIPEENAGEYYIEKIGQTVKESNPECSKTERVIIVAFEELLSKIKPEWAFLNKNELNEYSNSNKISTYAYPESRLYHINHALVNGVTIDITGVSDPINESYGAYAYTIKNEKITLHSEIKTVEYNGSYIDKSSVIYEGLISSLKWIHKNMNSVEGIVIKSEHDTSIKQLNKEYDILNTKNELLFYEVDKYLSNYKYINICSEMQYNQERLLSKAKNKYKHEILID